VGQYRRDVDAEDFAMIQKWIDSALKDGMKREPFQVGAKNQICLQHDPTNYYRRVFEIRNVAANGVMWDGKDGLIDVAAEHLKHTSEKGILENALSSAIRIRYGNFSYFTGGDLEGDFFGPDGKKFSYEARVGEVTGPVSVCKTNHHACPASMRDAFVKSVQPQLFLSSAWSPNQQNVTTLGRMTDHMNYVRRNEGYRNENLRLRKKGYVAYGAIPEFRLREFQIMDLASHLMPVGHAVVKVVPGGFAFKLYTLATCDESMRIVRVTDFLC